MGISLVGDIFAVWLTVVALGISTVAMVRACEAIQARLVATLSIVRELFGGYRDKVSLSRRQVWNEGS